MLRLFRNALNKIQNSAAAEVFGRRSNELLRQYIPVFEQGFADAGDVLLALSIRQAVGFGINDNEGQSFFAQPVNKFYINVLWRDIRIEQYKSTHQIGTAAEVALNHNFPLAAIGLRGARIAVAGQVHQIPVFVDEKKIDGLGFAGLAGGEGQVSAPRDEIDERRLAHIGAPDESKFPSVVFRAGQFGRVAACVLCGVDGHVESCFCRLQAIGSLPQAASLKL